MDRDKLYKLHVVDAIEKINSYVAGIDFEQFIHNQLIIDAVVRNLQIIGEAAKRFSVTFKASETEIPWSKIAGMRDVIIHDYMDVKTTIIWDTIKEDLPKLEEVLKKTSSK